MFLENLKRDFKWYFLISVAFLLARSWLNDSLPMHFLALPVVLIFRVLVAALMALLFYSCVFYTMRIFNWMRNRIS